MLNQILKTKGKDWHNSQELFMISVKQHQLFRRKRLCKFSRFGYSIVRKIGTRRFSGISSLNQPPQKSHHSIAGQYLLSHYGVDEDIATIIGGHHGRPVDDLDGLNSQKAIPPIITRMKRKIVSFIRNGSQIKKLFKLGFNRNRV